MKATGVVRRIDDLGRVVIPKEIRRTMRIREGDSLEIYLNQAGDVILKKYSPVADISSFAQQYADAMNGATGKGVVIVDREDIIAAAGDVKKQYYNRRASRPLSDMIEERVSKVAVEKEVLEITDGETTERSFVMMPLIAGGDALGAVIVMATKEGEVVDKNDEDIVKIATSFLGKYLEG